MRDLTRDSRTYELMIILSPDVSEEELGPAVERVSGYINDAGGSIQEILNDSPWGRRRLAYPIRHAGRDMRDGFYAVYHFSLSPENVQEVEREIKLNDQIMRYLVVQYKQPTTPAPQPEAIAPEAEAAGEAPTEIAPEAFATAADALTEMTAPTAEAAPAEEAPEAAAAPAEEPAAEAGPIEAEAAPAAEETAPAPVSASEPETVPEAAAGDEVATALAGEEEAPTGEEEAAKED